MNMTDFEQLSYARQLYPTGIAVKLKSEEDADIMHAPIYGKVKAVLDDCSINIVLESGEEILVKPGAACMERVTSKEIE